MFLNRMFINYFNIQDSEVNSMNGSHTIPHHNSVKTGAAGSVTPFPEQLRVISQKSGYGQ